MENFTDFEIESKDVQVTDEDGNSSTVLQITVTDTREDSGEGVDTLINVEELIFNDANIFVGVNEMQRIYFNGFEEVAGGSDIFGSIFSDTITGTDLDDYIMGDAGSDTLLGQDGPDWFIGGLGNDTIRGGSNGLDEWGSPGEDVAEYTGNKSLYTITYYDNDGTVSTSYKSDGYVKVKTKNR